MTAPQKKIQDWSDQELVAFVLASRFTLDPLYVELAKRLDFALTRLKSVETELPKVCELLRTQA